MGHGEADRLGGDPELLWARLPRVERQVCQLAGRSPGASKTAIRRGHGLRSRSRPCGRTRGVERAATKRRCRQRRGCARGLPIERHDRALVVVVRLSLERTFPPSAASAREVGGLALGRRRQRKSMRQPGTLRVGLPGAARLQARHAPGSRMAEDHRAGELTRRQPRAQIRQGLVLGGAQGCHGKRVRSPSRRRGRAGALCEARSQRHWQERSILAAIVGRRNRRQQPRQRPRTASPGPRTRDRGHGQGPRGVLGAVGCRWRAGRGLTR